MLDIRSLKIWLVVDVCISFLSSPLITKKALFSFSLVNTPLRHDTTLYKRINSRRIFFRLFLTFSHDNRSDQLRGEAWISALQVTYTSARRFMDCEFFSPVSG